MGCSRGMVGLYEYLYNIYSGLLKKELVWMVASSAIVAYNSRAMKVGCQSAQPGATVG